MSMDSSSPTDNTPSATEDAEILVDIENPPKEPVSKVSSKKIKEDADKRSKDRPILQKIMKFIKRNETPFKELIINAEPLERRVALLGNGVLEKFDVERTGETRMVGAIFKGKIQNHEPGLKAAFVDIGQPKNAFLHYWDIIPESGSTQDSSIEYVRDNRKNKKNDKPKIALKDIPQHYPIDTDIVVQITKAQIGTKGPRVTTNISIPGRYLVLTPHSPQCGISRKIEDSKERNRLKKIINTLTIPEGMGVIVRTAGEGKKIRYFIRDLHLLLQKWDKINDAIEDPNHAPLVDQEPDLLERTVRDFLTEDIDRILVDNQEDAQTIANLIAPISPRSRNKVAFFNEDIPIFERFNIERQIEQTFMRRVPLPSGGEIVIEETEALVAVDVNTGSHKGSSKDGKDYILNANLEAAREVSRQIRLRNIGGLIILDFIDMKNRKDRKALLDCMREEMEKDRAKCQILPISPLGIMQMTRQRHKESTSSGLYDGCPYCRGRGIIKSVRTLSVELQRRLVSILRYHRRSHPNEGNPVMHLRVYLHPLLLERLRTEDEIHLIEIEQTYNAHLSFRADPAYHLENFKIVDPQTGRELT